MIPLLLFDSSSFDSSSSSFNFSSSSFEPAMTIEEHLRSSSTQLLLTAFDATKSPPKDKQRMATALEHAVFKHIGNDIEQYKLRIRDLYTNFKRYPSIMERLMLGLESPGHIAVCPESEWAPIKVQQHDEAEREDALRMEVLPDVDCKAMAEFSKANIPEH